MIFVDRVYFRKKGQGDPHWKEHYTFNLRAPYFCTASDTAGRSGGVCAANSPVELCGQSPRKILKFQPF